jgi:glycosyltransferase involved in cell wall biosynthesis
MAEVVVLLRGVGADAERRRTIEALKTHTPDLELLLCDSQLPSGDWLRRAFNGDRPVVVIGSRSPSDELPDDLAWRIVEAASEPDVVALEIGTAVQAEWLRRLREAAYADAVVATASAVPAASLQHGEAEWDHSLRRAETSRGTALGTPIWGCVYIRRDALRIAQNTVGRIDVSAAGTAPRIEDLITQPGLVHVLSTAVVRPPGGSSGDRASLLCTSGVRRALAEIDAAVEPIRVTIDLRCCALPLSGTQVHALNLAFALAVRPDLRLSVVVPEREHQSVAPYLDALPASVERYSSGRAIEPQPQVFHRPYQLLSELEIEDVVGLGTRLVLTHQDLILDRTPGYFESQDQWFRYTAATALGLAAADEAVFFSEHAREEAARDGLVDRAKTVVVPPGTDHLDDPEGSESMPSGVAVLLARAERPFILVMGNAYAHKNRVFALRVADELLQIHRWEGALIFAGERPGHGSSARDETAFLAGHDLLRSRFVDLGRVSDSERRWLYRHAVLVLFPTLYEGFGLVPFEAAAMNTPCVYSNRSSVADYLPLDGALLDLGDVPETARRVQALLESSHARAKIVRLIRLASASLTWERTAEAYVDVYRRALARPVGLSLVAGGSVVIGTRPEMVMNETERRLLVLFRRSMAIRVVATALVGAAHGVHRVARRLKRQ